MPSSYVSIRKSNNKNGPSKEYSSTKHKGNLCDRRVTWSRSLSDQKISVPPENFEEKNVFHLKPIQIRIPSLKEAITKEEYESDDEVKMINLTQKNSIVNSEKKQKKSHREPIKMNKIQNNGNSKNLGKNRTKLNKNFNNKFEGEFQNKPIETSKKKKKDVFNFFKTKSANPKILHPKNEKAEGLLEKNQRKSISNLELNLNPCEFGDHINSCENINELKNTIEMTKSRLWKIYNTLTASNNNKIEEDSVPLSLKTKIILKKLQTFNISRLTLKCVSLNPEDVIAMTECLQFAIDHDAQYVSLAHGSPREFARKTGNDILKFTRLESLGLSLDHLAMLIITPTDLALAGQVTLDKGVGTAIEETAIQAVTEMVSVGTNITPEKNIFEVSSQTENTNMKISQTQTDLPITTQIELQILENKLRLFNIDKKRLETVGLSFKLIHAMTEEISRYALRDPNISKITSLWPEIAVKSLEALGLTVQHLSLLIITPYDVAAFASEYIKNSKQNLSVTNGNNANKHRKKDYACNYHSKYKRNSKNNSEHMVNHKVPENNIAEPIKSDNEDEKKSLDRWFDKINHKSEPKELTVSGILEANATPVERVILRENHKVKRPQGTGSTYILEDVPDKSDGFQIPSKEKKGYMDYKNKYNNKERGKSSGELTGQVTPAESPVNKNKYHSRKNLKPTWRV